MTNPNVPANQAEAAKSSAPDAKVMPSQPAQLNQSAPAAAPAAGVPVDSTQRMQSATQDQKDQDAARKLQSDRADEQKDVKAAEASTRSANQNDDYFQKVADDAKMAGTDPFREQARLERQREEDMSKGDPTRDPAAKQAAMDMNTPAPGALEEAEAMNKGKQQ